MSLMVVAVVMVLELLLWGDTRGGVMGVVIVMVGVFSDIGCLGGEVISSGYNESGIHYC